MGYRGPLAEYPVCSQAKSQVPMLSNNLRDDPFLALFIFDVVSNFPTVPIPRRNEPLAISANFHAPCPNASPIIPLKMTCLNGLDLHLLPPGRGCIVYCPYATISHNRLNQLDTGFLSRVIGQSCLRASYSSSGHNLSKKTHWENFKN